MAFETVLNTPLLNYYDMIEVLLLFSSGEEGWRGGGGGGLRSGDVYAYKHTQN